ncbi:hypothetical protein SAMN02745751_03175 [Dethiosulfatibacter aminovorans DSM 17477]|uniref:Uncharacterized protein n=1 Tax=Dethiosulfatibacter aminovorans DSM 17477 TaxID=1121476 RepID=A0A1M6LHC7_9FIRM|nr:hypothetical protein [Dethiosulfatibacter aminovorans]SHJ70586.1 hypothetical protein SAMN02745751_03175 [Dethiosulfatibacter aminovorans DSM 17477]
MYSITITVILIIFYGISNWLVWQDLKENTSLPRGSFPRKHGFAVGWFLKFLILGEIISLCINYGWLHLIILPIAWFFGGWTATLLERKAYMNRMLEEIKKINMSRLDSAYDYKLTVMMLDFPEWWVSLMSTEFKRELFNKREELMRHGIRLGFK